MCRISSVSRGITSSNSRWMECCTCLTWWPESKDYKNAGCRRMSVARSLNAHCNQCSYSKKSRSLAICMHAIRFSRWDRFLDLLLYAGRRVYRPLPFLSPNVAVFSMTWLLPAGWERIIILALRWQSNIIIGRLGNCDVPAYCSVLP